ncbi:BACON domain-containing protein [Aliikangiella maris]|uniref:Uncharacterized protein n=2 Tax=Aliikangiella maris TaxID=3162458 RepID=A0ABV2BZ07_9GAMM
MNLGSQLKLFVTYVLVCSALSLLLACGGGGGGGGSSYSLTLDKTALKFETVYLSQEYLSQSVTVKFVGDGVIVGTPPDTTLPNWLSVATMKQTTTSAEFRIDVDASFLAPGNYQTVLRFITGKADASDYVTKDLSVSLVIKDQLITNTESLNFAVKEYQQMAIEPQVIQLNMYDQSTRWTAESNQDWITISQTEGNGNSELQVSITNFSELSGINTGEIIINGINTASNISIPISLKIRPRKIYASRRGIALIANPTIKKLTSQVEIYDNANVSTAVNSINSDSDWLTASFIAANQIQITASDQGLASGIYVGQLTINSKVDEKSYSDYINVGLYVSDEPSQEGNIALINNENDNYGTHVAMAKDIIRPYLYVYDKTTEKLNRINIHTGVVDNPFPTVLNESFSGLVVDARGEKLIAHSDQVRSIYQFDLTDFSYNKVDFSSNFINPSRLKSIYPNGKSLLLIEEGGMIIDLSSGETLTNEQSFGGLTYSPGMAVNRNQKVLYGAEFGLSGSSLYRFELDYDYSDSAIQIEQTDKISAPISNGQDIASNQDGSSIYTASGGHYQFAKYSYDAVNGLAFETDLPGGAYPSSVEVDDNGVLYGGRDNYYGEETVYVYDANGVFLKNYSIGTYRSLLRGDKGMIISGDGTRLLLISTEHISGSKTNLWSFPTIQ